MKGLAVFLFFCLALASAAFVERQKPVEVVDQTFLVRQRNILQLFYRVYQPNGYQEQVTLGREYNIQANLDHFDDEGVVKEFFYFYNNRTMLPRGRTFSPMYTQLKAEVAYLYQLFFHAKDFETFYKTACWAREHVNEEMFVYAFTAALYHRSDCHNFYVPPLYNVFPQYFFTSDVVDRAQKVRLQGNTKFMQPYAFERENDKAFYVRANYSCAHYSYSPEQSLTYFTEDIGLNTFYYNAHLEFPYWMQGLEGENRGDVFFFLHQQILSRYYLERLSNGLGEIPEFSWESPVHEGYDPYLSFADGVRFPYRPNDFEFEQYLPYVEHVQNYERRIRDAIDRGFFEKNNGEKVYIRSPESLEVVADVLESNTASVNFDYYGYPQFLARALVANSPFPESWHQIYPGALEFYQTSLRDPAFYQLFKHYYGFFEQYQNFLIPYTADELSCPGVKIENVDVGKLVTYFEDFETEISSAVYGQTNEYLTSETVSIQAVQGRLNHRPFTVTTNLYSEKQTKVTFRFFLGPKYNGQGNFIDFNRNRENFFQLDQFVYELKSGKNVVERPSSDFWFFAEDYAESRDVLRNLAQFAKKSVDKYEYFGEHPYQRAFSFPSRLALPKGSRGGLPLYFYVIVTPYQAPKAVEGVQYPLVDQFGYGYPFDRRVDDEAFFLHAENMHFEDVVVYHRTEAEINRPQQ